jgi:hypothetical protein
MSLVLLNSSSEELNRFTRSTQTGSGAATFVNASAMGIENPASFTNFIHDPLVIGKNSEVAVQSVSFNRAPMMTFLEDQRFYFYFGQSLRVASAAGGANRGTSYYLALEDTCSRPFPIVIPRGSYNRETWAATVQEALRRGILHPDMYNMAECLRVKGVADTNADGFQFNFFQKAGDGEGYDPATQDIAVDMIDWIPYDSRSVLLADGSSNVRYTNGGAGATPRLTRHGAGTDTDSGAVIGTNYPLGTLAGNATFDVSNAGNDWSVGLTRPTVWDRDSATAVTGGTGRTAPPYWQDTRPFCDYQVTFFTDGGVGTLTLQHAVWDGARYQLADIEYYGTGIGTLPTNQLTTANMGTASGASTPDTIEFIYTGERLTVYLTAADGFKQLMSDNGKFTTTSAITNADSKGRTFKKVNQNCWAMYPMISLKHDTTYVDVTKYLADEGMGSDDPEANKWAYHYPRPAYFYSAALVGLTSGRSYWGNAAANADLMIQAQEIDTRPQFVMDNGVDVRFLPIGLDDNGEGIDYEMALVLVPTAETVNTTHQGAYVNDGTGIGSMLGFESQALIITGVDGTTESQDGTADTGARAGWSVLSTDEPKYPSTTLILQAPSLTHQSYNMAKSSISKFLYHVPKYDNSGRDHGNLFYEPTEKTYVKLRNREDLNINDISITLTDLWGRETQDLTGETSVVLHFR